MNFSHFGELWLAWNHGGSITSGMHVATYWMKVAAPGEAWWGFGIGCRGSVALLKAIWWDLRLASLLMHLFLSFLKFNFYLHRSICSPDSNS